MKKIILVLCLIGSLLILLLYSQSHPLIGEWESNKGDRVGPIIDNNGPYRVTFSKDTIKIIDKLIFIDYILETEKKNTLYIQSLEYGSQLEIKCLNHDTIQFYFPSLGLRQYSRKNKWNFFSQCESKLKPSN